MVTDASGFIYVVGTFTDTIHLSGHAADTLISASGTEDVFVAKYSPGGDSLYWFDKLSSFETHRAYGIAIDNSANLVVAASSGSVDTKTKSGSTVITTLGWEQTNFISYNTTNGGINWYSAIYEAFNLGPVNVRAMTMDASANIYFSGNMTDTVDFDPGAGVAKIHHAGNAEAGFVASLDDNGIYRWAKALTTPGTSDKSSMDAIHLIANDVYVAGKAGGTSYTFGGLSAPLNDQNSVLAKLDASTGAEKRFVNFLGTESVISGITSAGNQLWITGAFKDTVDFDPNAPVQQVGLGASSDKEAFITSLDTALNYRSHAVFGDNSTGVDSISSVKFNGAGELIVAGFFESSNTDFDPTSGTLSPIGYVGGWDACCNLRYW